MENDKWKIVSLSGPIVFSWKGDEGSRTLIIRFTRPTLCYPVELHRHENWWTGRDSNPRRKFAGLLCCRYITSPEYLSFVICGCALPLVRPICCWRASK